MRQTFADRASERASELAIERLDARENPAPIAPEQVGRALAATPALMRALAEMALSWSGDLQPAVNRFAEVMPAAAAIFRDPDIQSTSPTSSSDPTTRSSSRRGRRSATTGCSCSRTTGSRRSTTRAIASR